MGRFFIIAIRNLLKNRTRSLILGSAIASVTALMVMFMAIAAGIQKTILTNALALASGHVNIAGFYKISQNSAAPMVIKFNDLMDLAKNQVPEAYLVIDRIKSYGKIISETGSVMVPMWGVDFNQEEDILGQLITREGDLNGLKNRGTIALFEVQAKKLNARPGDSVTVSMPTYRNMSNTIDLRVTAILQDVGMMSNFSVFLNKEDNRTIYQMDDNTTGQIMIFLKEPRRLKEVEERLRKLIADKGLILMEKESLPFWMKFDRVAGESWTGQKIDITTWKDETAFMKWVLDIFHVLTFMMTAILMVIVVLGLVNTLWMSIRERTNEIGTLRAIGLQRRQALILFFLEALTLSVTSTLVGISVGSGISQLLNSLHISLTSDAFRMFLASNHLVLSLEPMNLLLTFIMITLFLGLGSVYPAYKAGKMKPITAINTVN